MTISKPEGCRPAGGLRGIGMMILFLVVVMFCLLAKSREAHVCLWLCVFLSPCRLKSPLATEPKRKLQSRPLQTDTTDHYSDAQATGPAAAAGLPSPIPSSLPLRPSHPRSIIGWSPSDRNGWRDTRSTWEGMRAVEAKHTPLGSALSACPTPCAQVPWLHPAYYYTA